MCMYKLILVLRRFYSVCGASDNGVMCCRSRDDAESSCITWSHVSGPVQARCSDVSSLCQCSPWSVDVVAYRQRLALRRITSVAGTSENERAVYPTFVHCVISVFLLKKRVRHWKRSISHLFLADRGTRCTSAPL